MSLGRKLCPFSCCLWSHCHSPWWQQPSHQWRSWEYVEQATDFKDRFNAHSRSFRIRDPKIQTTLSTHIWNLKDQNVNHSVTWQIIEKTRSFNPITLQCLLCISEAVNILNPNLSTLNSRSEIYGYCRHRKKYLLKHVKPLALNGDALSYRWKNQLWSHYVNLKFPFYYCNFMQNHF